MKIPKHILKKQEKMNRLIEEAYGLKYEIEDWAKGKGADVHGTEWFEEVVDDIGGIFPYYDNGLDDYFKKMEERKIS